MHAIAFGYSNEVVAIQRLLYYCITVEPPIKDPLSRGQYK